MAELIHSIIWLLEALRLWQVSEKSALVTDLAYHGETTDLYHERNIPYWCLRPPC